MYNKTSNTKYWNLLINQVKFRLETDTRDFHPFAETRRKNNFMYLHETYVLVTGTSFLPLWDTKATFYTIFKSKRFIFKKGQKCRADIYSNLIHWRKEITWCDASHTSSTGCYVGKVFGFLQNWNKVMRRVLLTWPRWIMKRNILNVIVCIIAYYAYFLTLKMFINAFILIYWYYN